MSKVDPLNDPELRRLERELARLAPAPSLRERERTLYACGQAVGRAQMKRRAHVSLACALVFSIASASASVIYVRDRGGHASTIVLDGTSKFSGEKAKSPTGDRSRDSRIPGEMRPERTPIDNRQLTAVSSLEQLLTTEREERIPPTRGIAAGCVMTAGGYTICNL